MKRTFSIVLIILILFNKVGYYGFLLGLQYHHERKLIRTFDAQSETLSGTISIKVPIAIPYASESPTYERVNGVFEYQGEFLRLVKQRLQKDTLELVCVRDVEHRNINLAFENHTNSLIDSAAGDVPVSKTTSLIKDYLATIISLSGAAVGWKRQLDATSVKIALYSSLLLPLIQPPELG